MSVEKRDFYGKEVTDAIKNACETMNVSQEMLDIEVVETGSTGIFGLIRKKARIRVSRKEANRRQQVQEDKPPARVEVNLEKEPVQSEPLQSERVQSEPVQFEPLQSEPVQFEPAEPIEEMLSEPEEDLELESAMEGAEDDEDDNDDVTVTVGEEEVDASPESLEIVKTEVARLVELMGFPSTVDVTTEGLSVTCSIRGQFEEELAGPEGKTLDSIQYLIRKMAARKCSERLRIIINVGNFRERRLDELKERAVELANKVKETGKTQVLPALNPSERREIHMVLQEDKEVRSRSVGDGLFKKILIYKPGKGNRGGRRKSTPRNRRAKGSKNDTTPTEE